MTKSMLVRSVIVVGSLTALAGCSTISSSLGLERHVPDEKQVVVRPALTLPPDFDLLPPGTQTAVSGEHESGSSMAAAADGTPAAPKKEERGFFGSLFHGDFFGNDVDAAAAKEHADQNAAAAAAASAPAPDVNATPQAPAAAVSVPPADAAAAPADAAPAPKKDEPGFFSRVFGGLF